MKAHHVQSKSWPPLIMPTLRKHKKLKYLLWAISIAISSVSLGLLAGIVADVDSLATRLEDSIPTVDQLVDGIDMQPAVDEILKGLEPALEGVQEIEQILKNICASPAFKSVCNI